MKFCLTTIISFFLMFSFTTHGKSNSFQIDFRCCGEMINCWDPAYSNAVLKAVFPYFKDFARELDLPRPRMDQVKDFLPGHVRRTKGDLEGGLTLRDGTVWGFLDGHVTVYESGDSYFTLQDLQRYEGAWGTPNMTQREALEFARKTIKKIGYSLEDVLANLEPEVAGLEHTGTNILPRYRFKWRDPRSGAIRTEIEVNAEKKKIESIRFNYIVALKRPNPKVKVEPAPLDPNGNAFQRTWIQMNNQGDDINHEYAYRLVPVVFKAAEDWARKFKLNVPLPITSNEVARFYCSNNGGVPYVEMTLKNNWQFTYRVNEITYAGSPRRFFDSDTLPFHIKNFTGKWNLTEEEAIELARQTISQAGFSLSSLHMDEPPKVTRPKQIQGLPTIPRLWLEWKYPRIEPNHGVEQWVEIEVDCDRGTIETLHLDDVRTWDKKPDLGVPIEPRSDATKADQPLPSQIRIVPEAPYIAPPPVGIPKGDFSDPTPHSFPSMAIRER